MSCLPIGQNHNLIELNQGMPIHSLRKLVGHQHLSTNEIYAPLYDETLYRQFREATVLLEGLAAEERPQTISPGLGEVEMEVAEDITFETSR